MNFRILLFFVLTSVSLAGNSNPSEKIIDDVFRLIYNQQFSEADSLLESKRDKIEPFYADILTIDLNWRRHVLYPSELNAQQFNSLLKSMEQEKTNTPEKKIKHLVWLSYQLRFEFKRYNIIGAIRLRSEIKNLLEEIKVNELNYSNNRIKLYYLYNALFTYFDNILNPFFSEKIRNERENALRNIEKYTREDDLILSTLGSYFLGKIYLNIEKEPEKGNLYFKTLTDRYPQNTVFQELFSESARKS
jgi:hypothetical protein